MTNVVLLGDSVFDNGSYVQGPDVVEQLRADLAAGSAATLLAVDGAIIREVAGQLWKVPDDATHLVVSVGGNDALRYSGVLAGPSLSTGEAVGQLAKVQDAFAHDYQNMVDVLLGQRCPSALCTIYNPRFSDPVQQRLSVTALAILNDVILRTAFRHGLPVLDLRLVCSDPADYANDIEPSVRGGEKIAATIAGLLASHDFRSNRSTVYF